MKKLVLWNQERIFMEFAKTIATHVAKNIKKDLVFRSAFLEMDDEYDVDRIQAVVKFKRFPEYDTYCGVAMIDMGHPDDNGETLAVEFHTLERILAIAWWANTCIDNDSIENAVYEYDRKGGYNAW